MCVLLFELWSNVHLISMQCTYCTYLLVYVYIHTYVHMYICTQSVFKLWSNVPINKCSKYVHITAEVLYQLSELLSDVLVDVLCVINKY